MSEEEEKIKIYNKLKKKYLEDGKNLLNENDLYQASEKLWGATALALKEYALLKDDKPLKTHRDIWDYAKKIFKEDSRIKFDYETKFFNINTLHTCFYGDSSLTEAEIREILKHVEELINLLR